ncbi:MAG TPA: 50S ribosomal protein L11 methyltransferase [Thermoanaerobaculia bacterium]|nr:50S ribosomal protein L11 methyltransferase [Thermoanaerobaculia bacterium]
MLDYILEVSFPPGHPELDDAAEGILFMTSCLGSRIEEREGATVVSCYFDSVDHRLEALEALRRIDGLEVTTAEIERSDWLELYRQSLEPLFIGERFVVVPDARLIPESARIPIVIPQERAFGTGSHESTSMCLAALETIPLSNRRGLDIGTGSGILAIAMLRLGASKVFAFDNDPETWEVLPKNLERNSVPEGAIPFFIAGIDAIRGSSRFDAITMNILPYVIIPNLPRVATMLAPEGRLVLSGVLLTHRPEVLEAATAAGLILEAEKGRGEWWCGIVKAADGIALRT